MKVISGYLKGRRLFFPAGSKSLRPTKDLIREAIFDVLRGWIADKRVLDLFAGTGALGIEAISHGAREVVFVELEREAISIIKKNIETLGITGQCSIRKGKAEKIIEELSKEKFDLIIADPPYGYPENKIASMLKSIVRFQMICQGGVAIIEHRSRYLLPEVEGLTVYKEKIYGKNKVSYLKINIEYGKNSGLSR